MNIIELEPVKTYATRENAIKALNKWYSKNFGNATARVCNATVLQHTDGRFFVVLLNIDPDWMSRIIAATHDGGFNLVN